MKETLVVYYSFDGNTQLVAEKVAETLGAHLLRLRPENEPPKNALKFLLGGKSVLFGERARLNRFHEDPADYENIILCSPVWAGRVTPAIREFVLAHPFERKKVGLIACSASGDASAMLQHLKGLIGGNEVIAEISLRNPKRNPEAIQPQLDEFCRQFSSLSGASS